MTLTLTKDEVERIVKFKIESTVAFTSLTKGSVLDVVFDAYGSPTRFCTIVFQEEDTVGKNAT